MLGDEPFRCRPVGPTLSGHGTVLRRQPGIYRWRTACDGYHIRNFSYERDHELFATHGISGGWMLSDHSVRGCDGHSHGRYPEGLNDGRKSTTHLLLQWHWTRA